MKFVFSIDLTVLYKSFFYTDGKKHHRSFNRNQTSLMKVLKTGRNMNRNIHKPGTG